MYGNAMALAEMNKLAGDEAKAAEYSKEAAELKELVENKLWNGKHEFFETLQTDTLANVREAIGFIPWYFNMPDNKSMMPRGSRLPTRRASLPLTVLPPVSVARRSSAPMVPELVSGMVPYGLLPRVRR